VFIRRLPPELERARSARLRAMGVIRAALAQLSSAPRVEKGLRARGCAEFLRGFRSGSAGRSRPNGTSRELRISPALFGDAAACSTRRRRAARRAGAAINDYRPAPQSRRCRH